MVDQVRTSSNRTTAAGADTPLGATPTAAGVNFAVYSQHASEVFLLLYSAAAGQPTDVIALAGPTNGVWHIHVDGVAPGQLYGYRVAGQYDPATGLRFNSAKVVLDPYAKAVTGKFRNTDNLLLAYDPQPGAGEQTLDARDSGPVVPKAIVVDDTAFDWQGDAPRALALEELIIYEVHTKGFTAAPILGCEIPGHIPGLHREDPVSAGVGGQRRRAPAGARVLRRRLPADRGLTNYWGYNSIGFFAPDRLRHGATPGLPGRRVQDARPRTAQGGHRGHSRRRLQPHRRRQRDGPDDLLPRYRQPELLHSHRPADQPGRYYTNFSGCGNTLDFDSPAVIRLVMDSLRYWVQDMHVDGFRFDLASVLGRDRQGRGSRPTLRSSTRCSRIRCWAD